MAKLLTVLPWPYALPTLCYLRDDGEVQDHSLLPPGETLDRMTAALWCRSSLGGVILGGTHVIEGPEDGFFGGAVIYPTH